MGTEETDRSEERRQYMRMRKFASRAKANRFAKVMHMKAVRVKASKLSDGTKGALYKFKKRKGKRRTKKARRRKR